MSTQPTLYWDEESGTWVTAPSAAHLPPPAVPSQAPVPEPTQYDPGAPESLYDAGAPWTPAVPVRDGTRNRTALAAAVAVFVCGGLAGGGLLLFGGGDDTATQPPSASAPEQTAPPSPEGSAPADDGLPGDEASVTASESSSFVAPPGYVIAAEEGFTFAVPEGWERRQEGVSVYYEEQGQVGQFIQVFKVTEDTTPYNALQITEATKEGKYGYRRNSLTDSGDSAELDYSYTSPQNGERRILDHVFRTDDGVMYAVLTAGPAADWPAQREVLDAAVNSFCAGYACSAFD